MNTNEAFEMLLDKLIDVAADRRLVEESRSDLQAKLLDVEMKLTVAQRDLIGFKNDRDLTRKNYEKLKATVPAKMLAEHEKAIDDIPF